MTTAEIAATLAGFTGIITLFQSVRAKSEQIRRIIVMLLVCFLVIVTALLPTALSSYTLPEHLIWGIPCSLIGLCLLGMGLESSFAWYKGHVTPVFRYFTVTLLAVMIAFSIYLLAVGIGLAGHVSESTLLTAHIALLVFAGYIFTSTLVWSQSDDT